MDSITREEFENHLRECLGLLYDPYRLRRSPLAELFGVAGEQDTPTALRRVLTEAIQSLEPGADAPDDSRAWRMYESMYYRYVEQFTQEEVADQMGLSARQVRREQRAALETLAYQLWNRFDLADVNVEDDSDVDVPSDAAVSEELAWLKESPPDATTDLQQVLPAILDLAQPLADRWDAELALTYHDPTIPEVAIDAVGLRQILLNLLGVAIARSDPQGPVVLAVSAAGWDVHIHVEAESDPAAPSDISKDHAAKLSLAEQLAQMCGCHLEVDSQPHRFSATVSVAGVAQIPVLVIDDNVGTLQLIQRYLQDTRYRLMEARQAEEAVPVAAKLSPAIIVLDVMMPNVDGWEILGRLREHPGTRSIPVVVCTILAQRELALALGASAFVQKPFTRQAFLEMLDRQVEQVENLRECLPP